MADNYLEKKMEDYRSGKTSLPSRRPRPTKAFFVVDGLSEVGIAEVRRLRAVGDCHVAFAGLDRRLGTALAQQTGSRYYPVDPSDPDAIQTAIADATHRWSPLPLQIL